METTIDYFGRNWDDSTRLRYVFEQCFDREKLAELFPYGQKRIEQEPFIEVLCDVNLSMREKASKLGYTDSSFRTEVKTFSKAVPKLLKPALAYYLKLCSDADLIKDTSSNSRQHPIQFIVDIFNILQFKDIISNWDLYKQAALISQDELLILLLGYTGFIKYINIPYTCQGTKHFWLDSIPALVSSDSKESLRTSGMKHIPALYLFNFNKGQKVSLYLMEYLQLKRCSRCGLIKPYTNFHKFTKFSHKCLEYNHRCKCCQNIANLERDEHIINADYSKVWNDPIDLIYILKAKGQHVDHIIPLRGKLVSGLHIGSNLQLLSAEDNLKKNNKHDPLTYRHILPDGTDVFGR